MNSHWTDYWNQGYLTSFGGSFKHNYEGKLKDCWTRAFETLPETFRALDLATGNGALAFLLEEFANINNKKGEIIGVDLAQMNVSKNREPLNPAVKVELVSGINCDDLSSISGHFNLITSQFGVEYANLTNVIEQVFQKLTAQGYAGFVLHHSSSVIISRNKKTLEILQDSDFALAVDRFKDLVSQTFEVTTPDKVHELKHNQYAESIRKNLNSCLNKLDGKYGQSLSDTELPNYINGFFQYELLANQKRKLDYLNMVENELDVLKLRLSELVKSALNKEDITVLLDQLRVECEIVDVDELVDKHGLLAWQVLCKKRQLNN